MAGVTNKTCSSDNIFLKMIRKVFDLFYYIWLGQLNNFQLNWTQGLGSRSSDACKAGLVLYRGSALTVMWAYVM